MSAVLGVVKKHIKGTERKAPVVQLTVLVCNLTNVVKDALGFQTMRVYVTTNALKHMYDKRIAQEFDFLMENLPTIIKHPTKVYENKGGKTGGYCFSREFGANVYFCIIEKKEESDPNNGDLGMNYVVSAYKLPEEAEKRERYVSGYKLLWSWEGDIPPS